MTWAAVSTSGYRIAGTRTIKGRQATDRRGLTRLVPHGSFDQVLGETTKAMSDRPVAKVTTPGCGTQLMDSALPHRPRGRALFGKIFFFFFFFFLCLFCFFRLFFV